MKNNYFDTLNPIIKDYFKILAPEGIPKFLCEYIATDAMRANWKI